ncbi:MAG: acyl-CoA desaturase [Terrimicrobiaceae bacterium]|nr:acyl-CoA desaturase [Terrimicrobiaceae bacterium]
MTTSTASSTNSAFAPTESTPDSSRLSLRPGMMRRFIRFFDSDYFPDGADRVRELPERFEWSRALPFAILHAGCLAVIWTGWSWTAVVTAAALYFIRMFAVTGLYHRYFCHRAFKTSRPVQFGFAILGLTAAQRGPLWWSAVHRHHHQHSDDASDVHSPGWKGFLWSHMGWLTSSRNFPTDYRRVSDLARYPELVFLNRFDLIGPLLLFVALFATGALLGAVAPGLHTGGGQLVVWGFFISTVLLFHGTCAVNSFAHVFGTQRYDTGDESRNSFLIALITLGEGWHNNHHRHQAAARQGFYWWEIDISYYVLRVLAALGVIWDLRPVPRAAYARTNPARR